MRKASTSACYKTVLDYVGRIFRPPSEAQSLLLQVTVGCSHNRCVYCDMYRDKRFTTKPWATVEADLVEAARMGPRAFDRVFLCDGDALILPTRKLLQILEAIREHLPWVQRVGTYGDTRSIRKKSLDELVALREAGLQIVYHGVESGDPEVLRRIDKGGEREEVIAMAKLLRQAGIAHSVILLLGIGGVELSAQHARNTASLLSAIDPPYVGALTVTVLPGTPLAELEAAGEFTLPDPFALLEELRVLVADAEVTKCRFSSNHASNYLPLRSVLPGDRRAVLEVIDEVLRVRDPKMLKPESLRAL